MSTILEVNNFMRSKSLVDRMLRANLISSEPDAIAEQLREMSRWNDTVISTMEQVVTRYMVKNNIL